MARIYLDYASATPVLPEVRQAMAAWLEKFGNSSSLHAEGREAKRSLEQARKQVALLLNAKPEEIYFTSCGSESNNWALRGLLAANKRKGNHLIISSIEHPSVLLAAKRLEREDWDVTYLPVTGEGVVEPKTLTAALTSTTVLVSIMHANGEIGTMEPIAELAALAREAGALFHTDAIASAGQVAINVRELKVDALSLAANQFYGPAGAAALFVREGVRILPLIDGGGQEVGARSGTESVLNLVGMGVAAESAQHRIFRGHDMGNSHRTQYRVPGNSLRDRLKDGLLERVEHIRLNGSWTSRLPHNLHVCIEGASSESLVLGLDQEGIAAGIGSACNSKAMRPSHVLKAIGLSDEEAQGALLLSVGAQTTEDEMDRALEIIPRVVNQLRHVTALTSRA
ncbi:MAG: cysteine desulfurase [Candidatus Omnitrophica bacterium]|nr:cysteine desulfurase [Candidatus Omnitrophota bacterium]